MAIAVLVGLSLGACTTTREERVMKALEKEGYVEVQLEKKNSTRYDFTALRDGVECEGTAKVEPKGTGYTAKEAVSVDGSCR